ncbi:MAG TPA: glutamine synthetase family protein [Candidatus Wallbacteria bacterium]|nr:glutamine synthetase family protein [Candidatus Wallbacteria bacterium]
MRKEEVISLLNESGVNFLRVLWCDNANVIRSKAISTAVLNDNYEYPVSISAAQQAVPVMFDGVVNNAGLGPVGEVHLKPDYNTLSLLNYCQGHASVIGDMTFKGELWQCCPRNYLKKAVAAAAAMGYKINAGFENEFYLFKPTDDDTKPAPVDESLFAMAASMNVSGPVIGQIAKSLSQQGIVVERYYPEGGNGQQELTVKYDNALRAADNQIIFRQTVHGVTMANNLVASFMPKIFEEAAGSGCHLHISLEKTDGNAHASFGKYNMPSAVESFMAGVMKRLPALCAASMPSTNSYKRIKPHMWSGAFNCWGYDNREAAVRVITSPDAKSVSHFELKSCDASANPYVALASVIFAGLDGVENNLELPAPVDCDPGNYDAKTLAEKNIKLLPQDLGAALEELEKDEVIKKAMGEDFYRAYSAVKKTEWNYMKTFSIDRERKLLLRRY